MTSIGCCLRKCTVAMLRAPLHQIHLVSIKNRGRLPGKQVHSCWRRGKTTKLLSGHWVSKMSAYYQKRKASLTPTASRESRKDTVNLHSQSTRCLGQQAQGHIDTKHNLFSLSVTNKVPCLDWLYPFSVIYKIPQIVLIF